MTEAIWPSLNCSPSDLLQRKFVDTCFRLQNTSQHKNHNLQKNKLTNWTSLKLRMYALLNDTVKGMRKYTDWEKNPGKPHIL